MVLLIQWRRKKKVEEKEQKDKQNEIDYTIQGIKIQSSKVQYSTVQNKTDWNG